MNFKRADRVAELIMAEMSDIVFKQVKDPRVHAVTITAVKVTDDLRNAKIYFVEMGKDECSDATELLSGKTDLAAKTAAESGEIDGRQVRRDSHRHHRQITESQNF